MGGWVDLPVKAKLLVDLLDSLTGRSNQVRVPNINQFVLGKQRHVFEVGVVHASKVADDVALDPVLVFVRRSLQAPLDEELLVQLVGGLVDLVGIAADVNELGARKKLTEDADTGRVGGRFEDQALVLVSKKDLFKEKRNGVLPGGELLCGAVFEGEITLVEMILTRKDRTHVGRKTGKIGNGKFVLKGGG